ncbi:MAG: hypothetical protein ACOYIG_10595 [Acetivibrionales bacterium]|jgi:hypothetical protein|nr:hypothetical protein [Clostridiaceae bacterium]
MKIADSRVQMNAQWSAVKQHSAKETIQFWTQEQNQITNDNISLDISEQGKALQQNAAIARPDKVSDDSELSLSEKDKEKIRLIEKFIYVLTGKKIKLKVFDTEKMDKEDLDELENVKANHEQGQVPIRQPLGWGLKYDRQEFYREAESMSFSSSGSVVTEDGRTINFNLNFNVSREFMSYHHISIRAGDALIDPLVINFENASASLGDRNYSFDIDCDGKKDNIAFTGFGSGFLALDRNNNNIIDDGSELFGPQSGNGFNELAVYDEDQNGWIDENDEIFNKLRIWTLDEEGNKTLLALGQVGVGAIYLGNVRSEFGMKNSANDSLGLIRSTGVFLKENGQAGTIQHVDLTV